MSVNQIIKGTLNNLLNLEEDLYKNRIEICRKCKLLIDNKVFGEICNPALYLNPKTNETSKVPKPGFVKGCSCVMGSKARVKEAHCVAGKW